MNKQSLSLDTLLAQYPALNAPKISRRALLAAGSLLAMNLAGCGGGGAGTAPNNVNSSLMIANGGVVTTLAGSMLSGSADGTGSAASFRSPMGLAVDAAGNIYVADSVNHMIRKVSAAGVVTTLAGSTTSGNADGTGAAASFRRPMGLAVDAAGNIYVADSSNNMIRKVTAAGVVTTLAGSIAPGYADGTGSAARFSTPFGVAVDAAGNVYVADYASCRIRKVTAAGVVTTLAGSTWGSSDGTGSGAAFGSPWGLGVDAAGNVYVVDSDNHMIRKVTAAGVVTTLAGSTTPGHADGTGSAASFDSPSGLAVDAAGDLYVADNGNSMIRKVTAAGVVTTLAGSTTTGYADGTGAAAKFRQPVALAVDANGTVYVADTDNNMIRKIA